MRGRPAPSSARLPPPESLLQELAVGGVFGKWVLNNRRSTEGAVRAFRVGRGGVHDVLVVGAARRGKTALGLGFPLGRLRVARSAALASKVADVSRPIARAA